jgi:rhodanese-related sulfurtransferase
MSDPLRVSPKEASERMQSGFTYVDVRSEPEFAEGHPDGAVNVPLMHMGAGAMTPNADFLRVMQANFAKDAAVIVGCKGGGRSLRAARSLGGAGYTNVVDQRAGWNGAQDAFGQITEPGWSRVGLPTESGQPEGRSYEALKVRAKVEGSSSPSGQG